MKTNSFILGAAALMLATACSNDEVVQVAEQGAAIGFSNFVNNSTRAIDNTAANLTSLNVYGVSYSDAIDPFKVFSGDVVSKDANGAWTYSPLRYWIANNTYSFAAVAPAGVATVTQGTGKTNGGVESIYFENSGTVDLLFDNVEDPAANTTVGFDLHHILSRVMFAFENGMHYGYAIKVSDVKINNADTKASYNLSSWTLADDNEAKEFPFTMVEGKDKVSANNVAQTEPMYLFPSTDTKYSATFTVTLYDEQGDADDIEMLSNTFTVEIPTRSYQLGYSYILKTVLNDTNIDPNNQLTPIKFTVNTVDAWDPEVDQDFTTSKTDVDNN